MSVVNDLLGSTVLDYGGTAVFAIGGTLAAGRARLDLVGVAVIASVSAIGGGTIRDLLLDREVFWIRAQWTLVVILAASAVTVAYTHRYRVPRQSLAVSDAFGLALFGTSGALIADSSGADPLVVVVLATISGVGGGALRDLLLSQVPEVLRTGLYATPVIVGAAAFVVLAGLDAPEGVPSGVCLATILVLRLGAIFTEWNAPTYRLRDRRGTSRNKERD